jgi:zinc/manganese transport system substrate-binding protein/manganese/iron transport system substrate-binding protein
MKQEHRAARLSRQRKTRTLAVIALFSGASLAVAGCSTSATPSPDEGIRVVATTTQLADFTSAVVGDDGFVSGLVLPNASAHQFDPSARNLLDIGEADALVVNGVGLESWLQDLTDAGAFSGALIVATEGIELRDGEGDAEDPHVWTSPRNAAVMVNNIVRGLSEARPDLADIFYQNAVEYLEKLTLLDTWATEAFASVAPEKRLLITNHDALGYFVDAYGITFVGSIMPSLDDNSEPSALEIDALIERIRQEGAIAVFSESTLSDKLAATIASEAGVAVYSGDDALYADSLGAPGTAGATYLGATIHNVTVLVTAWGGTVPPLPDGLTS